MPILRMGKLQRRGTQLLEQSPGRPLSCCGQGSVGVLLIQHLRKPTPRVGRSLLLGGEEEGRSRWRPRGISRVWGGSRGRGRGCLGRWGQGCEPTQARSFAASEVPA